MRHPRARVALSAAMLRAEMCSTSKLYGPGGCGSGARVSKQRTQSQQQRRTHVQRAAAGDGDAEGDDFRRVHLVLAVQHLAAPGLQEARHRHAHVRPLAGRREQEGLPQVVRGALARARVSQHARAPTQQHPRAPAAKSSCPFAAWRYTCARRPEQSTASDARERRANTPVLASRHDAPARGTRACRTPPGQPPPRSGRAQHGCM